MIQLKLKSEMTQYKNPNYWFLLLSALVMIAIGVASYFIPEKIPLSANNLPVKLYRLNYGVLALMALLSNNLVIVRSYLIITGWIMIFFVVSTWVHFPIAGMFEFTKQDNILHSNIGVISIFIGVIYGESSDPEKSL